MTTNNTSNTKTLKINVGFLLKESAGYTREVVVESHGTVIIGEVELDELDGILRLTRTSQGVLVQGELDAIMTIDCVRCLTPFGYAFGIQFQDLFVPHMHPDAADPNNPYVISDGYIIDLSPIVREESILAVPMTAVCSEDCKGICSKCGVNLNEETCDCVHDEIDPRLDALRSLLED